MASSGSEIVGTKKRWCLCWKDFLIFQCMHLYKNLLLLLSCLRVLKTFSCVIQLSNNISLVPGSVLLEGCMAVIQGIV